MGSLGMMASVAMAARAEGVATTVPEAEPPVTTAPTAPTAPGVATVEPGADEEVPSRLDYPPTSRPILRAATPAAGDLLGAARSGPSIPSPAPTTASDGPGALPPATGPSPSLPASTTSVAPATTVLATTVPAITVPATTTTTSATTTTSTVPLPTTTTTISSAS
ncbi:MAG: hypothetical protein GY929_04100 [Actinomycetia bacterium]|nr:hypothetical protein [Actinomycetes bacterium]